MTMEIRSADVIRLILQFLKENNLNMSFETLQYESKICINAGNKKQLSLDILSGKWDAVLREVKNMLLPEEYVMSQFRKLLNLHELIIEDMLDHDERQAAQFAFVNFVKDIIKNKQHEQRVLRLEYLCREGTKQELFQGVNKQKKKEIVAAQLSGEVIEAPPSRLTRLLGESLRYQIEHGLVNPNIKLDFFTDHRFQFKQEQEVIAKNVQKMVKYPIESKINAIAFSKRGTYLAIGCEDGLIEVYDPNNYQVSTQLPYQNEGNLMFHAESISCIAFNETEDMFASGDRTGVAKIWAIATGKCLRKLQTGSHPVSAVTFGLEPSHVLCCFEKIQLFGLRSSTVLREYRGHQAYINAIVVHNNQLITCSKDGSIKCWNYASQEELKSYSPLSGLITPEIFNLRVFGEGRMAICTKSNVIIISQTDLKSFENIYADNKEDTFESWACSGLQGNYVYAGSKTQNQHKLLVFNSKTKRIEYFQNSQSQLVLLEHHPTRNLLVSVSKNGELAFWRP